MQKFLTAEWRDLIMANYVVEPDVLADRVPDGTSLDFHDGKLFVSLVGFMFLDTRVLGIPVPFHINFEEVNLPFYVKRETPDEVRRGVCFVKEIVPRFPTEWRITVLSVPPFNTGQSSAYVQYFIAGPDLDVLTRATASIMKDAKAVPGIRDLDSHFSRSGECGRGP